MVEQLPLKQQVVGSTPTGRTMKAIIAAAGKGTRMLHLSKDKPKHLIEVLGKPFLYYVLKNLQTAGIEEIIIVAGYQIAEMEKFKKQYENELNIRIIDQFQLFGEEKYGTSVPIEAVETEIGNEEFIAIYGDNLYSPKDIKKFLNTDGFHYIGVIHNAHPEKYGVAVIGENNYLEKIVEKPKEFIGNFINTGIYKFTPEIFDEVKKVRTSPRGEYELTDAIQALAEQNRVKVLKLEDYWLDFGKPEDIQKVEKFLKSAT